MPHILACVCARALTPYTHTHTPSTYEVSTDEFYASWLLQADFKQHEDKNSVVEHVVPNCPYSH
jgi:hypothetical protein